MERSSSYGLRHAMMSAQSEVSRGRRRTRPTVAPVNLTRKNALVPEAISVERKAREKSWYGAWKSIPKPMPARRRYKLCRLRVVFSSRVIIKPDSALGNRKEHGTYRAHRIPWRILQGQRISPAFARWCPAFAFANTR